ncbi:THUMP domain protein [Methanocaldococcus vulcanius M7]|uniref:THUMP domain protein n=1 Tax=Methanocaldococcus vulcanius (strain ATCC 700851 / DSM 12094 / M7) TaxID=579137 RepID=C9RGK2_METVM|nr:SPOUT family RNA methylase [Methanocaldococcus vulcanius]ACX72704.1 THUMP domain protein [Methanocaldococcus vulcanius M7]
MKFIIKTQKGFENIVVNNLKEVIDNFNYELTPNGYQGIVIIETEKDIEEELLKIPEVERVLKVYFETEADFDKIVNLAEKIKDHIQENETFAVETKKRGKHEFSSSDVNIVLGAKIKDLTNATVDLTHPNKVVHVEIFKDKAYISITPGEKYRKYTKEKRNARDLFKKVVVVQMPYLGEKIVCKKFGEAIGRSAQGFEIKELIISPKEKVNAYELMEFIKGVKIGQQSRYEIQKRAYPFDIKLVPITVQDLYQVVRDKRRDNRLLIITDPKGDELSKIRDNLQKDLRKKKEVIIFCGSREGIPRGLFRFADYVIDLAPHMTFATEHAIPAALIALWTIYSQEE